MGSCSSEIYRHATNGNWRDNFDCLEQVAYLQLSERGGSNDSLLEAANTFFVGNINHVKPVAIRQQSPKQLLIEHKIKATSLEGMT